MYGYVRPCKGELKVREYELFKARYCGLCHALKKGYGPFARFLVNYDFTFLSMLLQSPEESEQICSKRCPVSPFRKKSCCVQTEALSAAADGSVLLGWWKLRDSASDKGFFRGIPYRTAALLFTPAMRRAAKRRPELSSKIKDLLDELGGIENSQLASLDAPADCFGRLLSSFSVFVSADDAAPLGQLLYHIGRWVYIIDALDDIEEDAGSGSYNPLILRFKADKSGLSEEDRQYVSVTLKHSAAIAAAAFELMKKNEWTSILSNIIYLGLPETAERVFAGTWDANKKEK